MSDERERYFNDRVDTEKKTLSNLSSREKICRLCGKDPTLPEPCPAHNADCPYIYS